LKILVTGGSGFIGSAVCRHCILDLGLQVVNVDALTYASTRDSTASISTSSNYKFYRANILHRQDIDRVISLEKPDAVLHLAAESHVDRSIDGPLAFVQTNVVGTVTLLESVREYLSKCSEEVRAKFRFLHVSTDEVFGSLPLVGSQFVETTPYEPSSPYSASKAASDHFVRAYSKTFNLPVLLTNCSNNYGPYQFPEKLIPLITIKAMRGEQLPVYGTGNNVRDWLHVEDHARAITQVLLRGRLGESYNIGGNEERSNLEVVRAICDELDAKLPNSARSPRQGLITFVADRPGHDLRYAIDSTKVRTEIGWKPRMDFATGLRATIDWYLENEAWWKPLVSNNDKRLGENKP
jgi:dTDP-glucose 4,6-dehydratase